MSFEGDKNYQYREDNNANNWENDPNAGGENLKNTMNVERQRVATCGETQDVKVEEWAPSHETAVVEGQVPTVVTNNNDPPSWFSWKSYSLGFVSGAAAAGVLSYFLR